jgi:hypothetical protein
LPTFRIFLNFPDLRNISSHPEHYQTDGGKQTPAQKAFNLTLRPGNLSFLVGVSFPMALYLAPSVNTGLTATLHLLTKQARQQIVKLRSALSEESRSPKTKVKVFHEVTKWFYAD